MRRNDFLNVLKADIEGLDKYSAFDNSKVLLEKAPDAFDYFLSLYAKAFPKGKLEGHTPKTVILDSDLHYFKMELGLIDGYNYGLAYKDFYHIQQMKYWLSCKEEIQGIGVIYGEYVSIPEILEDTGYTLSDLYHEMNGIVRDFKRNYREQLRKNELECKRMERTALADKVKKSKEETARKLAELKGNKEGSSMVIDKETEQRIKDFKPYKPKIEVQPIDLSALNKVNTSNNTWVDLTASYCDFIKGIVKASENVEDLSKNVENLTLKEIRVISSELKDSGIESTLKKVMDLIEMLNF